MEGKVGGEAVISACPACGPCLTKSGRVKRKHEFGYWGPYVAQYQADFRCSDIWIQCERCGHAVGGPRDGWDTEEAAIAEWNRAVQGHELAFATPRDD